MNGADGPRQFRAQRGRCGRDYVPVGWEGQADRPRTWYRTSVPKGASRVPHARCPNCADPVLPGAAFCARCGQSLAPGAALRPPAAAPGAKSTTWKAVGLVAGLLFLLALVASHLDPGTVTSTKLAAAATSRPATSTAAATTPAPAPTDTPTPVETLTPKPDRHADRQIAQDYWKRVIGKAAFAQNAMLFATANAMNADAVSTYQFVKTAKKFADDGANEAGTNVPPGWDDVSEHMSNAMAGYSAGFDRALSAIDSEKTSDWAEALESTRNAKDEYDQAVHLARVHYIDMGGRWQDVSDGAAEQKALVQLEQMMLGGRE